MLPNAIAVLFGGGGTGSGVVCECRRCGTTVDSEAEACPRCGPEAPIVRHEID